MKKEVSILKYRKVVSYEIVEYSKSISSPSHGVRVICTVDTEGLAKNLCTALSDQFSGCGAASRGSKRGFNVEESSVEDAIQEEIDFYNK